MLLPEGYHQKTYQRGSWECYRSTAVNHFVSPHRAMFHSGLSGTDAEVWVCCLAPKGPNEYVTQTNAACVWTNPNPNPNPI